jgi:hypothetical protein
MSNEAKSSEQVSGRVTQGSISRFFSGGGKQQGSSNFGAMCEVMAGSIQLGHSSVKCRACDGLGYRELSVEDLQRRARRVAEAQLELADAEKIQDSDLRTRRRGEATENLKKTRAALSRESDCIVCKGVGYTDPTRSDRATAMHSLFTTVWCATCRGCGEPVGPMVKLEANARTYRFYPLNPTDDSAERQDRCERCDGTAYLVPVTVRSTGSSKGGKAPSRSEAGGADEASDGTVLREGEAAPSWADEDDLAERGRVSRALEAIRRDKPDVAAALEAYYGPEGDKWGPHKWGRMFALWPLTQAGRKLAELGASRSKGGHGWLIAPIDLISNERDTDSRSDVRDPGRRALIGQADKQARELHARMQRAINGTEAA